VVAIVGNPNAGKTTLFNSLTGSHQKVGNYPGVTVEQASGTLRLGAGLVDVVDVPGLYSLTPVSEDERVAVDVLSGAAGPRPDLLVCAIDATNLERNLFFFSQLADAGYPTVVALTMADRLAAQGRSIDIAKMSHLLGVDVVPLVGHRRSSVQALREAIERNLDEPRVPSLDRAQADPLEIKVASLRERLARLGADFDNEAIRRGILDPDGSFEAYLRDFPEMREAFDAARADLAGRPTNADPAQAATRYEWAEMVQRAVMHAPEGGVQRSATDRLDAILTHRVFGLAIFIGLMYLVFQSIYSFAEPVMGLIEEAFGWLGGVVGPSLEGAPILRSLVVDGLIMGVGSVMVFLPQILILFFFVAVLEGTGYLARAAFLMDRLLGWCGLNGRAFIPLLSSYACAIPGIMAARVMPDPRGRLATILVAPLMSCSARLPVYLLLIGAFVEPRYGAFWAGFALFAMHFLGLAVAIPIVWILNRRVIGGKRLPFLLELPPYQWPKWRDVGLAMYFRARIFVKTAGTIIVVMSMIIWALLYFPQPTPAQEDRRAEAYALVHPDASEAALERHLSEEQRANSILGRFGRTIEPVFRPAGFDWRITTSILAAFPAREVVVPSLGIIFAVGDEVEEDSVELRGALAGATWPDGRPLMTTWTAIGLMVFFALCAQCMATLATVRRETNSWKWPVFMFVYMTGLAYIGAVLVHQVGRIFGG
jgi:ferrous iron transport protein B